MQHGPSGTTAYNEADSVSSFVTKRRGGPLYVFRLCLLRDPYGTLLGVVCYVCFAEFWLIGTFVWFHHRGNFIIIIIVRIHRVRHCHHDLLFHIYISLDDYAAVAQSQQFSTFTALLRNGSQRY